MADNRQLLVGKNIPLVSLNRISENYRRNLTIIPSSKTPKISMKYLLCLLILLLLWTSAQNDWALQKDKDGIKVYTKVLNDSDYKAYKGMAQVKGSIKTAAAALWDIEGMAKWAPPSGLRDVIENPKPNQLIYYGTSELPWPVSDRDGYYQATYNFNNSTQELEIVIKATPNFQSSKKEFIRVQKADITWQIKDIGNNTLEVIYQGHAEPNGSIPAWLANSMVVSVPFETLEGLRKQMDVAKYQNPQLSFLK